MIVVRTIQDIVSTGTVIFSPRSIEHLPVGSLEILLRSIAALAWCVRNHYPQRHSDTCTLAYGVCDQQRDISRNTYCTECTKPLWRSIHICGFVDLKHFATLPCCFYKIILKKWLRSLFCIMLYPCLLHCHFPLPRNHIPCHLHVPSCHLGNAILP
jgi:hypothetical protein